jgi:hypothetical protein
MFEAWLRAASRLDARLYVLYMFLFLPMVLFREQRKQGGRGRGAEFEIRMCRRPLDHNIWELRKTQRRKSGINFWPFSQ